MCKIDIKYYTLSLIQLYLGFVAFGSEDKLDGRMVVRSMEQTQYSNTKYRRKLFSSYNISASSGGMLLYS